MTVASPLHSADLRVVTETAARRVEGGQILGQEGQRLVGHGCIGHDHDGRRADGPHRPAGGRCLLGLRSGDLTERVPLKRSLAHQDCPEVVVDLFVVVVGVVEVAVDVDADDGELVGVVDAEALEDLVDVVAVDDPVVTDVAAADDVLAVDATSTPRPTALAEAATPIAAVIRRTRTMARSRSNSASRRRGWELSCGDTSSPF